MRGAGTSIAGNAVGAGIVVDTSRHLNQVLALDREARTALVQPGVVHAAPAAGWPFPTGLRFGPDPSTHTRCTIGGMIGNNACGSRALGYGRTVDNVEALTVLLADGTSCVRGRTRWLTAAIDERLDPRPTSTPSHALVDQHLERRPHRVRPLRPAGLRATPSSTCCPRTAAGSTGSSSAPRAPWAWSSTRPCAWSRTLRSERWSCSATRRWPTPRTPYPPCWSTPWSPARASTSGSSTWCSGRPELPAGGGLAVRRGHGGDRARRPQARAARGRPHCRRTAPHRHRHPRAARAVADPRGRRRPGRPFAEPARPGRLGGRRRAARAARRLPARLRRAAQAERAGRRSLRPLRRRLRARAHRLRARGRRWPRQVTASSSSSAADLVASYGGSMSGEHGDGRARSELLPRMYSPQAIALMQQAKRILDPDNLLNPGVLVDPAPFDSDLRLATPPRPLRTTLRLTHDAGSFAGAVHRCTGVGKCIADNTGVGRRDVPVVPRHPRGEGLHPRPRPRAPGRGHGRPRRSTTRPSTTPSTCACPARAARGTARPASTWPPTSPRCSPRSTPDRGASCAAALALRARPAAALGAG